MATTKYNVTESIGDEMVSDVVLTAQDRALVGRLQSAELAFQQKQAEFADYISSLKEAEETVKKYKEKLYEAMEARGAKSIESDILKITLVSPSERFSIDTKKLAAVDPRLFAKVKEKAGKTTQVKGYVKITDKRARQQQITTQSAA